MKKYFLLVMMLVSIVTITQAQKNKKQVNKAVSTAATSEENKDWKPTKGDTRNPFDSNKVKQVKANGLGVGEDPFGKTNKLKGELTTYKKSTARSRKGANVSPGQPGYDSLKTKPGKVSGLSPIDDPFGKSGSKRKKPAVKNNGYANQEISYAKPTGATTPSSQNNTTRKPVKGKKQLKPVTPGNQ